MKAVFIAYNQAYNEEIADILEKHGQKGFTRWQGIQGRGTTDGIPRMGSHAWPENVDSILVVMDEDKVAPVLADLKKSDEAAHDLGLRAFVWNIETIY